MFIFKICDTYFSLAPYLNIHQYLESDPFMYPSLIKDLYLSPMQF